MRVGDFAVDVVPHGSGVVRELESGQVLARPGQVYRIRLRNLGPLYCVVDVDIDARRVTAGGLVLEPWGATELERPIDGSEDGRFTVVAEGNETVFGPDGGRDNAALGLIEAKFRRELPSSSRRRELPDSTQTPLAPRPAPDRGVPRPPSRYPIAPPEWTPSRNRLDGGPETAYDAIVSRAVPMQSPNVVRTQEAAIERAAGTGLTGHSDQRFVPIQLGPLESEATVIQLRLVIGTEQALAEEAARPLVERHAPPRPAPRP